MNNVANYDTQLKGVGDFVLQRFFCDNQIVVLNVD